MKKQFFTLIALAVAITSFAQKKPLYNLENAKDNMDAYVKMREV